MPEGKVISFRLPPEAVKLLAEQKQSRESLNQVAQRLVLEILGLYTVDGEASARSSFTLSTEDLDNQIQTKLQPIEQKISDLEDQLKKL